MDVEKTILRKVGEAVGRFRMIRAGDRVAVGVSGGKDSLTLLEALSRLQKRAPIDFSVCAFTIEQGKFLQPIEAGGRLLAQPRFRLDLCQGQPFLEPSDGTARPRLRYLQPVSPARGL